jgi:two-component system, OmpR family, sensor kinase
MSLRARLLLAMSTLVLVGLIVTAVVTYTMLRAFLLQRIDQQLRTARDPVVHTLESGQVPTLPGGSDLGRAELLPPGTVGEVVAEGQILAHVQFTYGQEKTSPPALPPGLPSLTHERVLTVEAAPPSSLRYRLLAEPVANSNAVLIIAIPLTAVDETLARLLLIEGLVALTVVLVLAALSWWIVQRELRPLARMANTAGAIAAGDLSERVAPTDRRTEIGRLGIALNKMLTQIEQAFAARRASEDRMRRFLADASHELRTPLTSIRGYAELFRRGATRRPEDLSESLRRIEEEAQRMGVLVEDLLLLARLDEGRPLELAPVDLAALAGDAVADARAVAPDRLITIRTDGSKTVMGDKLRLQQVASNLLRNALAHTPEGSPIEVRVGAETGKALLEVKDHGPGISPEERALIFEPFYRGDPARRRGNGSGLGLAIAAAIVEAHQGEIGVHSVPGEGATFRVTLPSQVIPS